jgi:hypothetical protein
MEPPRFLIRPLGTDRPSRIWWLAVFFILALLYLSCLRLPGGLYYDWSNAVAAAQFTGEGFRKGYFPWVSSLPLQRTNFFWGNPEFPCPPLSVAFALGPANGYFLLLLFSLAIGLAGAARLSRRLRLSPLSSLVPVGVTFLGGPFVTHYAVGHFMWQGLLLAPVALLLVLNQSNTARLRLACQWGLFLALLLCLGALHVACWFTGFFLLAALFRRDFRLAGWTVLAVLVFGAFRIFPAAYAFSKAGSLPCFGGFLSLDQMLSSVAILRPITFEPVSARGGHLNYWEYSAFASMAFTVLLVVAGVVGRRFGPWCRLRLPLLVFALASLSVVYVWVCWLPVPFATFQRIPSRFFAVAVLFSFWLLAPVLQVIARRHPGWFSLAVALGLHDLYVHLRWHDTSQLMVDYDSGEVPVLLPVDLPAGDPFMVISWVGIAITAAAVVLETARVRLGQNTSSTVSSGE